MGYGWCGLQFSEQNLVRLKKEQLYVYNMIEKTVEGTRLTLGFSIFLTYLLSIHSK